MVISERKEIDDYKPTTAVNGMLNEKKLKKNADKLHVSIVWKLS